MPLLEFVNVSLQYNTLDGQTCAVEHITHSFRHGAFTAVVGPSGCGKSTLLHLAAGLLKPDEGEILLEGKPFEGVNQNVGYMLQSDHLFDWLTVEKNALVGLKVRGILNDKTKARAHDLLERCGLGEFKRSYPKELSGGMRQRAALVRTLVLEPEILLLDEPFSAIDYQTRVALAEDLRRVLKESGTTAILVTHDIGEAISMSDSIAVLSKRPGKIKAVHEIDMGGTPIERRSGSAINEYFEMIWKELDISGN